MKPPVGIAERLAWQWSVAERPVLNVGCESDPAHLGTLADTVNVDIDEWEGVANFRQADARALPFDPRSFDTVLLCECLDHMEQPELAIQEAVRVARRLVAITLPSDDGAAEAPNHWVQHIEYLQTLGLKTLASGDQRLRHGHSKHWKEEDVYELMLRATMTIGRPVLYKRELGGADPPEWRLLVTP